MPNLTTVTVTAGVPTAGTGTVSTLDNLVGTAGSGSTNVLTVQGAGSGTAMPVSGTITANIAAAQTLATVTTVSAVTAITNALPAGTNLLGKVGIDQTTPGTTNLVALAANQSVNVAQINGVTTTMGNGVSGTGVQRVTIASDSTGVVGLNAGTARVGIIATPFMAVAGSVVTRPANTTVYTALDAVSNNATAGSVTAISFTLSDTNDDPVALERCRIASTDTGVAATVFRVWFYQSDPTASTGIVGGDNAAFSTKQGTFIGSMIGTFKTFSDGSVACCYPEDGARIITKPTSGAKTVFALLQTVSGFTPSANSTTFTPTLEAFQGRT